MQLDEPNHVPAAQDRLAGRRVATQAAAPSSPVARLSRPQAEAGWGGDGANQERSAGVAEFAADLGSAHGLTQAARWGGGEGREAEGGDDAGADADGDRGDGDTDRSRQQRGDGEPGGVME
jgi:hypothetical protein